MPQKSGSGAADPVRAEDIIAGLEGSLWSDVICHEAVSSTNDIALSMPLDQIHGGGAVIVADAQDNGRGRFKRRWASPLGVNIYMSMLFYATEFDRHIGLLPITAALASASALRAEGDLDMRIKWPNDLMVSGKKIGGVLAEARTGNDTVNRVVVGIGINVNTPLSDFPAEISNTATSVLIETGRHFPRVRIIARVLNELESRLRLLREDRSGIISEMKAMSSSLGRTVKVSGCGTIVSGVAEDIDEEGMLVLRLPSGATKRICSGDLFEMER